MRFHFSCTRNPHTEREVYTMRTPRLRLLSAILAVALFFTLLPVSALAEDSGSNANTGLTICIVGEFNNWDVSDITMKEVSPAVYEATIENTSYDEINHLPGFKFIKDHTYADQWSSSVTASSGTSYAVNYNDDDGSFITVSPGSDAEESTHNFIIRLDLTNWDWNTKTGATFTVTVAAATNKFYFYPTTGMITGYNGTDTVVVIPSKINGITVETIGHTAFRYSSVTSVTIPDSVTFISDSAFAYCSNLTNISIPNSVTSIGFSAFGGCTKLESITLPSSLRSISEALFSGCSQLTTIHIPVSVTSIENDAFDGCPSSMTVTYPGSKTQWDDNITKGSNNDVLENHLICAKLEATFTADGTTFAQPQTINRGEKFTKPAEPPKENHTFAGWYNGDEKEKFDFDADTTNAPNVLNLVAKWDINKYTVQFVSEHGSFADQTIEHGKPIDTDKLTPPIVEGFTFDGWYADKAHETKFDFNTQITSDTKVYAKWTAKDYEVSFITEHGDAPDSQNVKYNGTANDPGTLTEEGYTFIGWYTDHTCTTKFDFNTPIKSNTTVYAKWEKNAPVLPDTYALNVSGAFVYVDGVDVTAAAGDTTLPLKKDASVRLVADPDRMPSGMVFDRWTILNGALNADDAEKFETGRTLEEFAFTMPAEPLSIEATPRMQEEEGSDTVSVIAGVTLGTAATALVAWQAYDLGMSLYQEHWLPADFVMPKTRAELALLLWNTAGRPAPAAQPAFTDITDPDTAQAAQWAVETGLMTPKSADRFKPEKSVTRWKAVRSWKRVTNQNT